MTAADDRKVLMSVLVDFSSQDSINAEVQRWENNELEFFDSLQAHVDRLSEMLYESEKSGGLDLHKLNALIKEIAEAYQDYGVAFATRGSLKAFGEYLSQFDQIIEEQE